MTRQKPTRTFWAFSVLSLIYVLLIICLPPNEPTIKAYGLSHTEYLALYLLLAVPRIIVWFAAFYGYAKLATYSRQIHKTDEGQAFAKVSYGLRWLAWGLPLVSITANISGGIAHSYAGFLGPGLIITHFANLIISLVAFTFIGTGTRHLLQITGKQIPLSAIRILIGSFITLAVLYSYVTIHSVQVQHPNAYRMPMWLILLTVVIPYLYAWVMGLLASYEIALYRHQVRGLLYQRALSLLASGLGLAIISSVILQYIVATSGYLRRVHLDWNLLILYVTLVVYAIGFILIANGANKLKKIEEV